LQTLFVGQFFLIDTGIIQRIAHADGFPLERAVERPHQQRVFLLLLFAQRCRCCDLLFRHVPDFESFGWPCGSKCRRKSLHQWTNFTGATSQFFVQRGGVLSFHSLLQQKHSRSERGWIGNDERCCCLPAILLRNQSRICRIRHDDRCVTVLRDGCASHRIKQQRFLFNNHHQQQIRCIDKTRCHWVSWCRRLQQH